MLVAGLWFGVGVGRGMNDHVGFAIDAYIEILLSYICLNPCPALSAVAFSMKP